MTGVFQTLRQLGRRRRDTALFVGLLAMGIALSVSFYSVLDSALLSGLPFPGGERMVAFSTRTAPGWPMPLEDYRAVEAAQSSLEWILPLRTFNTMVTRGERTKGLIGSYVPAKLFQHLGVEPLLGRGFRPQDEDPASPPVVLISHRLWQNSYGGDPEILGEEIILNRERSVVVGVMPPGFGFPLRHDVWGVFGRQNREWHGSFVFGVGQLEPGVTVAQASQDLARITALLDQERPQSRPRDAALDYFTRANVGDRAQGALRAMVYAALGLLVLTCANLANLRLSESLRRREEMATRLALGSGPWGLIRLLLVENLLLGLMACALGLGLAYALVETLGRTLLSGGYLERIFWMHPQLDLDAAVLSMACALAASLLGALAPGIAALRWTHGRAGGMAGASRTRTATW